MAEFILIFLVIIGMAMFVMALQNRRVDCACWGLPPDLSDGASEDLASTGESGGGFDCGGDCDFFC